ncbi:MAG: exopolygalacturonase, partial [Muribaculaceae bacterium]|nr:exopolygalacturonase [Muribaculaceae bacterium]
MRLTAIILLGIVAFTSHAEFKTFPDGSPVSNWFNDSSLPKTEELGKRYVITDFGVDNDSCIIQT